MLLFKTIYRQVFEHLVQPLLEAEAPVTQLSWGAAIGVFVGLTPTMGIQMYVVTVVWAFCRYVLRMNFHLPVAVAMVWISNPVTVLPLYFLFLETGIWFLEYAGQSWEPLDFEGFREELFRELGARSPANWRERLGSGFLFIFWVYGWPILLGSFLWAIPLTLLTYPVTAFSVRKYRRMMASAGDLSALELKGKQVSPESGSATGPS